MQEDDKMRVYGPVKRTSTEKGSSVIYPPELIQTGLVSSAINTAYTFIPCDIANPRAVLLTPVKLGSVSANGVALATTVVGYQVDSIDTLSAITNLDAHAASIAYVAGNIVKATLTGGTAKAYACIVGHTSTAGPDFDTDYAAGNWLELPSTKFIKITHTAAGAAAVLHASYMIFGE